MEERVKELEFKLILGPTAKRVSLLEYALDALLHDVASNPNMAVSVARSYLPRIPNYRNGVE